MNNKKSMSRLTVFLLIDALVIMALVFLLKGYIEERVGAEVVYQFNQNLPSDYKITEGDIVAVEMPSSALSSHTIKSKEDLVGKYTSDKVYQGQVADDRYVAKSGREDALANIPDKEKKQLRKISIPADLMSTWGGSISRGDRVDLAFVGEIESKNLVDGSQDEIEYAKVFLQNVLVYDVISPSGASYLKPEDRPAIVIDPNANAEDATGIQAEIQKRSSIDFVVLAVTIQQYEEIVARQQVGEVVLVGRFKESESIITDGFAMGSVNKPVQLGSANVESKKAEIVSNSKRSDW